MNRYFLVVALFLSSQILAVNTAEVFVESIETRNNGLHALYLSGAIPSQNCSLSDRAVIVESDSGSKSQLSAALTAFSTGKKVVVGVVGCVDIGTGQSLTAPKVVKIQVYR